MRGKVLEELGCRSIIGNLLTNGPWERAIEKFDVAIGCTMPGRRGQPPTMKQVPDLLKSHTDACSNLILAVHERSEERRVGKECRSRRARDGYRKKKVQSAIGGNKDDSNNQEEWYE